MVRTFVRKTKPIDRETLAKAIAAVKQGKSVSGAAKEFKLNFETLRTHVNRSGEVAKKANKNKHQRETVSKPLLEKAIQAVSHGCTIAGAAQVFGLNYQTLRSNINRPMPTKRHQQVGIIVHSHSLTFYSSK